MDALIPAHRSEKVIQASKTQEKAQAKANPNAEKHKAPEQSSPWKNKSNSTSCDGDERADIGKAKSKGKEPTQKAPGKATPTVLRASNANSKRSLGDPEEPPMPPPQSASGERGKF